MRASFGTLMCPEPNGHTPARVRNKVDLPTPDGPLTRTCSPRPIDTSRALTSGAPPGRRTARSLKATALPSTGSMAIPVVAASPRAAATERSKPESRSITALHSARLR